MSTPEATVHVTAERSRQWQDSFHVLFDDVVKLEEMERPHGLGTYIEGYDADFDGYRAGLDARELSELNQYLGNTGPFRNNHGRAELLHRDRHPTHSEILRPVRYWRREVEVGPIEEFDRGRELSDNLHVRVAERRFAGTVHARFRGRDFTFSQESPMYEVSAYNPVAKRQALSLALAFHPLRQAVTLTRIVLHQPNLTDQRLDTIPPLLDDMLNLFHAQKDAGALTIRNGREVQQRQAG